MSKKVIDAETEIISHSIKSHKKSVVKIDTKRKSARKENLNLTKNGSMALKICMEWNWCGAERSAHETKMTFAF